MPLAVDLRHYSPTSQICWIWACRPPATLNSARQAPLNLLLSKILSAEWRAESPPVAASRPARRSVQPADCALVADHADRRLRRPNWVCLARRLHGRRVSRESHLASRTPDPQSSPRPRRCSQKGVDWLCLAHWGWRSPAAGDSRCHCLAPNRQQSIIHHQCRGRGLGGALSRVDVVWHSFVLAYSVV
jgi:hypothetical protein